MILKNKITGGPEFNRRAATVQKPLKEGFNSMTKIHGSMLGVALPLLAMVVCPLARAQGCSNATLRGSFATVVSRQSGVGPTAPGGANPVPRSGVSMTTFDGQGGVTDVDHIVGNGMQPATEWRSGTGTYIVNSDCTGKLMVNFGPGVPPLVLYFVVGKWGNEIFGAVGAPGANITSHGTKLESFFGF